MGATVRARMSKGVLKPLERLELPEGSEVTLTVLATPGGRNRAAFLRAAGGWKGLVDSKRLIRNIYKSRLVSTRPAPKL